MESVTKSELAKRYGVSTQAVDGWIRRGCPHGKTGRSYAFDPAEVAEWRAKRLAEESPRRGLRRVHPEAKKLLDDLALSAEEMVPWAHGEVVSLVEYEERCGLRDSGEVFEWMIYGFPILPPAPGEKLAQVSIPHAERWRMLFAVFINGLGGDGYALDSLGREARKLRGLPLPSLDDDGKEDL